MIPLNGRGNRHGELVDHQKAQSAASLHFYAAFHFCSALEQRRAQQH